MKHALRLFGRDARWHWPQCQQLRNTLLWKLTGNNKMLDTAAVVKKPNPRFLSLLFFTAFLSSHARDVQAETSYCKLNTEQLTVVANGTPGKCKRLARQFLSFDRVLRDLAGWDADVKLRPVQLYGLSKSDAQKVFFSDADRQKQKATGMTTFSKYMPGSDFDIAAIVDSDGADEPLQSALLLYGQGALSYGPSRSYPAWYVLGIANLLNGAVVRDDGGVILNRNLSFEVVTAGNKKTATFDLASMLQAGNAELNNPANIKEYIRIARDFAQFAVLTTPERRQKYRELATLMRQGTPPSEAVPEAFGKSLEELSSEFDGKQWRKEAQFKIAAPGERLVIPDSNQINETEALNLMQEIQSRVANAGS
ncbi:MAG: hypothetical protein QM808_17250 [Steroidobacteraceae bacterium]